MACGMPACKGIARTSDDRHAHPHCLAGRQAARIRLRIQRQIDEVYSTRELKGYIIDLVRQSRMHPDLALGASPRAAINLMKAGRVHALLQGRSFLTHEDIQAISLPVLAHRLILRAESEMDGKTMEGVVRQVVQAIPVLKDVKP